jgi:phosphatidylethanolamine/phosphatidyl-N-methylethanolamine N-methyltransferase
VLKAGKMDNASVITAYKRYARNYDRLFRWILDPGRRIAVEKMNCLPGEKVLEVGVGTGLSLFSYPGHTSVMGIDIFPHMLALANQRISSGNLRNCSLSLMDAQNMSFPGSSFDKVVAMYIASVVSNPQRMVSEMKRVCKPGGDLLILNHFSNCNRLIRASETMLLPLASIIGFRPMFSMDEFISDSSLDIVEIIPVNTFKYWALIHAKNR